MIFTFISNTEITIYQLIIHGYELQVNTNNRKIYTQFIISTWKIVNTS